MTPPSPQRSTSPCTVKTLAGAGAAVALAATMIGPAGANHTEQTYTVSSTANFRSGPGTTYSIIGVIVKGATFQINGQVQNGYAGVIYGGKTGWVLASLIVAASSSTPPPLIIGRSVTTTANVNLRSGPGTSYAILKVVPSGSQVGTTTLVQNGFRYVAYNGVLGWISTAYLSA
jgi:D-alanyl-D-alanine carboxypeptidase